MRQSEKELFFFSKILSTNWFRGRPGIGAPILHLTSNAKVPNDQTKVANFIRQLRPIKAKMKITT